ncbi:calcium-binding protein [Sinorhizobium meliloti]|uniref:calcium-binding protein n=1 Tax=Rhizobium meliloti TaxID=382 RepID=UPI000FD72583|nr:calcium-binding protein [Sinorhizobium meliloti]RVK32934.1 calcium-binding protein [Sinorhizobium meliloti]
MTRIVGTSADDTMDGMAEGDRIWSLDGNDVVDGGAGDDFVDGGAGDDALTSSSGFDEFTGGEGNDRLSFIGVGGAARGGTGVDTLVGDYAAISDAFLFDGMHGHAAFGDLSVKGNHLYFLDIERLSLTTGIGDDRIIATGFSFVNVHTGAGDDRVETGIGDDQIYAGDGRDLLFGGGGGDDDVNGGDGNDSLTGGLGSDTVTGGAGDDYLSNSFAAGDILLGGDGNDTLSAGGEDTAYGGWSDLYGGAGDDRLHIYTDGSLGALDGGEGFDRASIALDDVPAGFVLDASRFGSIEEFNITVKSAYRGVHLSGGNGNDRLFCFDTYREGPSGNDVLNGRNGDDILVGGSGADSLLGGDGNDSLSGEYHSDRLLGGAGADLLTGGSDADTFIWDEASVRNDRSVDRITDFPGGDGDVLLFRGFGGTEFRDFESFLAASRDTPEGVYVSFDGDAHGILIQNTLLADLSAADVLFA